MLDHDQELQEEIRELIEERDRLQTENHQFMDAIRKAGFEIMRTSAGISIHDVSEQAKADQEKTDKIILHNIDLIAACRSAIEYINTLSAEDKSCGGYEMIDELEKAIAKGEQ